MRFTKGHFIGISLLIAVSGLVLYGATYLAGELRLRHQAPSDIERTLSLDGLVLESGESLDLKQLRGKVVVVASWATWCPSCTQMLVDIARAEERFGNDIKVIAINRAEEAQVVRDYRNSVKLPDGISYVTDPNDAYFDSINGRSMPEMIIYTREGIVAEHRLDAPSFNELMTRLEELTK